MRRNNGAHRFVVRQVNQFLDRVDQGREQRVSPGLEFGEVGVLRNLPGLAPLFENFAERRPRIEERFLQIPQLGVGRVVEFEPSVGAENGDGRAEIVQHILVACDMPRQFLAHLYDFGPVDGKAADRAVGADGRFGQLHKPPVARRDDMSPAAMI